MRFALALFFLLTAAGCATLRTSSEFNPVSVNDVRFRDRAVSTADADVRVTVAVPSAEETRALFNADLTRREIQPVWIKVENHSGKTYHLISAATDPNYFSPSLWVWPWPGCSMKSAKPTGSVPRWKRRTVRPST